MWLSAPASGYFSSNLLPNATITLIYGYGYPPTPTLQGLCVKNAHLQKPGSESRPGATDGLIDPRATFALLDEVGNKNNAIWKK